MSKENITTKRRKKFNRDRFISTLGNIRVSVGKNNADLTEDVLLDISAEICQYMFETSHPTLSLIEKFNDASTIISSILNDAENITSLPPLFQSVKVIQSVINDFRDSCNKDVMEAEIILLAQQLAQKIRDFEINFLKFENDYPQLNPILESFLMQLNEIKDEIISVPQEY